MSLQFLSGIQAGSNMAPKTTTKKQWNASSNARCRERRQAVTLLNGLATELGLRAIGAKAAAAQVEALVRLLDKRCQTDGRPERLREAVAKYLDNGGRFSVPLLPAPTATTASASTMPGDADGDAPPPLARHRLLDEGFRLESKAFMLTYNSRAFAQATWPLFLAWVKERRRELGARRWAACFEESLNAQQPSAAGADGAPTVYHAHAYLWWTDGVGLRRRNTDELMFDGVRPRVDVCTCQAPRGRTLKLAATQGLWYVSVVKAGTVDAAENYKAWRDYVPKAEWYKGLWEAHKLSDEMYSTYSMQLRAGHAERKRDLAELEADERRRAVVDHVAREQARLSAAGDLRPVRAFPEVDAFVRAFEDDARRRRPVLAVVGGTGLGKSLLAANVLKRVGAVLGLGEFLEVTVEDDSFLDFTDLDIRRHAGVLLDGVGDAMVLKHSREVLQGRPKVCKAGRSPTMRFSSLYTLCRRAVVVTFDLSASNLHLLDTDHWLANEKNVIQLKLTSPAWETPGTAPATTPPPRAVMSQWSVNSVMSFAHGRDLAGPAAALFANGVNGADLLEATEDLLVKDVRLTPFAARKILAARDAFLVGQ